MGFSLHCEKSNKWNYLEFGVWKNSFIELPADKSYSEMFYAQIALWERAGWM